MAKRSKAFNIYLLMTTAFSGALVMIIEVLGSKVIGPFFGVSLFVWTSLITVTLVALSLGYAIGGRLADRRPNAANLYSILILAGGFVLLVPLFKLAVLEACQPLGLRLGAMTASSILFGPSLLLLGCVSPYVVKIAAGSMSNIGRTVGSLYAISTIGSFLGTVLAGFVLLAYLPVSRIFNLVGVALVLLGISYFALFRRPVAGLAVVVLVPFLSAGDAPLYSVLQDNGTRATELYRSSSYYGTVRVMEYSFGERRMREMTIDGLIQGAIDPKSGLSSHEYSYVVELLAYALHAGPKNALVVGLGTGIVPKRFEEAGIRTDVVDIDPQVVEAAQEYFDFSTSGSVFIEDARYHLNTSRTSYDIVFLDVFTGDTTPSHLTSIEAFRSMAERLTPDGVLIMNLITGYEGQTFVLSSLDLTLREVFDRVDVFRGDSGTEAGWGNLIVAAYRGGARSLDLSRFSRLPRNPHAEFALRSLQHPLAVPENRDASILSDDFNPIDFHDRIIKEKLRAGILAITESEFLL